MVQQAQAVRRVALATTDQSATTVRHVMTATPVDRAPRAMTVRHVTIAVHDPLVMTGLPAQIGPTALLGTNTHSVMVAPFAKAAMLTPRASSTVPFVRHGMSDVTYVPPAMTVRFATIVRRVTTALQVDHARCATTVHRARIAPIARSVPRVMTVRHATTVAQLVMTAAHEPIASRVTTARPVTTVPHAATRISILRVTRRRSTSPAKTSYSSVFRRWPQRPMTSMV
jgi:hypothetical protein